MLTINISKRAYFFYSYNILQLFFLEIIITLLLIWYKLILQHRVQSLGPQLKINHHKGYR